MHALANGLVGAAALTAIHELGRRTVDAPPRMDVVGMRAVRRLYELCGCKPPDAGRLFGVTLAGDLLSNALYYSAAANTAGRATWTRATALGIAAGLGAVLLPGPLGLGKPPHNENTRTRVLTVAYYLAGALIATAAARAGGRRGRITPRSNAAHAPA
jgi:hypothetical protein